MNCFSNMCLKSRSEYERDNEITRPNNHKQNKRRQDIIDNLKTQSQYIIQSPDAIRKKSDNDFSTNKIDKNSQNTLEPASKNFTNKNIKEKNKSKLKTGINNPSKNKFKTKKISNNTNDEQSFNVKLKKNTQYTSYKIIESDNNQPESDSNYNNEEESEEETNQKRKNNKNRASSESNSYEESESGIAKKAKEKKNKDNDNDELDNCSDDSIIDFDDLQKELESFNYEQSVKNSKYKKKLNINSQEEIHLVNDKKDVKYKKIKENTEIKKINSKEDKENEKEKEKNMNKKTKKKNKEAVKEDKSETESNSSYKIKDKQSKKNQKSELKNKNIEKNKNFKQIKKQEEEEDSGVYYHKPQKSNNETNSMILYPNALNSSGYKDPFSCHMCENIYKVAILNATPIKSSFKCAYCSNFLNDNSLKFFEMKYCTQNSMNNSSYLNLNIPSYMPNYSGYYSTTFNTNPNNNHTFVVENNNSMINQSLANNPNQIIRPEMIKTPHAYNHSVGELNSQINKVSSKSYINNKINDAIQFSTNVNLNNSSYLNTYDSMYKQSQIMNISTERINPMKIESIKNSNHINNLSTPQNNLTFTTENHNFSITKTDEKEKNDRFNGASRINRNNNEYMDQANKEKKGYKGSISLRKKLNSIDVNNVSYEANKLQQVESHIDKNLDSDPSLLDFETDIIINNIGKTNTDRRTNNNIYSKDYELDLEDNLSQRKNFNNLKKPKSKTNYNNYYQEEDLDEKNDYKSQEKLNKDECLLVFPNENYSAKKDRGKKEKKEVKTEQKEKSSKISNNKNRFKSEKLSLIPDHSNDNSDHISDTQKNVNNKVNVKKYNEDTNYNNESNDYDAENFVIFNKENKNSSLADMFKNKKKNLVEKIENREFDQEVLKEKYKIRLNTTKSVDIHKRANTINFVDDNTVKKKEPPAELIERLRKGEKIAVRNFYLI